MFQPFQRGGDTDNLTGLGLGLRGWSRISNLVISGRTDSVDKVRALDLGADDYVTKCFSTEEVLARIRALSRRTPAAADAPVITIADVIVDLPARQVARHGRPRSP
jgi:two-component system KDP operon response regulator KdpE